MVLQYILEEYASKTPGKRAYIHVNDAKGIPEKPMEKCLKSAENSPTHCTASQSDFARIIKMSVSAGGEKKKAAPKGEVAHFAYAGELMVLRRVVMWCVMLCFFVLCCVVITFLSSYLV